MYIEQLTLRNIKGFADAEFDFRRPNRTLAGWNVLVGRNGSGKSTVLKAIAMVLRGPEYTPKMQPDFGGWVREGEKSARIHAVVRSSPEFDHFQQPSKSRRGLELGLELTVVQSKSDEHADNTRTRLQSIGAEKMLEAASAGPWLNVPNGGWMLAGYGPFRRLGGESRDAHKVMSDTSGVGSVATLFREDASLVDASLWAQELETRRRRGEGKSLRGIQVVHASAASSMLRDLLSLIQDGLLPEGVQWDEIDDDGMWFRQGEFRLRLEQLSDGFRSVLALLLDLMRQLQLAYGPQEFVEYDGECPQVLCPGVVLIDEVETHLHPGWQQRLGPWLVRHFPFLQFVVTTHSPFVCQSASERGIFKLEPVGADEAVRKLDEREFWRVVNGSTDEALLTDLFGLDQSHSARSEQLRDELARLGAKQLRGKLTKQESAALREIERKLPTGPGPDIQKLLRVRRREED